jgi:hypothetical protein
MRTVDDRITKKFNARTSASSSIRSILKPIGTTRQASTSRTETLDSKKKKVSFHKKKSIFNYHPKSRISRFSAKHSKGKKG